VKDRGSFVAWEYSFWECIDRARPHWRRLGRWVWDRAPDDLMLPTTETRGYFELLSIVRANDDLLAHFGGRWDSRRSSHTTGPRKTWRFNRRRAARGPGELFGNDPYLLKDPRISILLPLWRQITNDKDCAVVIVRDPLEVAASLTRRDELRTLTVLRCGYVQPGDAARPSRARVHVCNYADLIENPSAVLTDIAASLGAWGEGPRTLTSRRRSLRSTRIFVGTRSSMRTSSPKRHPLR